MNKEQKRSLWGFLFLAMGGLIPLSMVSLYYYQPPPNINTQNLITEINHKSACQLLRGRAPEFSCHDSYKLVSSWKYITVDEIIIVEKAPVKKNLSNKNNRTTVPKKWTCQAPRPLEQGSGFVRECEWK